MVQIGNAKLKSNEIIETSKWLHIPTGKLLAVTASELIQCLSYPELEMEKIFELEVEDGWYAIIFGAYAGKLQVMETSWHLPELLQNVSCKCSIRPKTTDL